MGPICNPSLEAIDGVLHPAQHNYLYFQTDQVKNDGSNLYFETYEEHAAAAATTEDPAGQTEQTAPVEEGSQSTPAQAEDTASAGQ